MCHASCVTKETNKCDPLEQLALYTRQRELSTAATAGDSTTSLGCYPLELDNNLTALSGNIWKRSRAVLERRGSNLLASASRLDLSLSSSDHSAVNKCNRSVSGRSTGGSSSRGKENEQLLHSTSTQTSSGENDDTIRQSGCKAASASGEGIHLHTMSSGTGGHTKAKDSKSDCVVM